MRSSGVDRIKRPFERGESELMFSPDSGRAIINAGPPPINKPSKEEMARGRGTRLADDPALGRASGL